MSLLCAADLDGGLNEIYSPNHERPALMVAELHVNDKYVRQFDRKQSILGTTIEALNDFYIYIYIYIITFCSR